jgi:hypothetical protein
LQADVELTDTTGALLRIKKTQEPKQIIFHDGMTYTLAEYEGESV